MSAAPIDTATAARAHRGAARRKHTMSVGRHVILVVISIVILSPFFYVISTSLKDSTALFSYPPKWFSWPPYFGNYSEVLEHTDFLRWMLNTLIVASAATGIKIVVDSMAGYAFARISFPGRQPLFLMIVGTMLVPPAALIIPLFIIVRWLGWNDTYIGLIVPALANPLGVFMMKSFIEQLPRDIDSAARLDGASEWAIYRRIIIPLIKPGIVVLAIYTFLLQYTAFVWPLVITNSENMRVLTTGLASMTTLFTVNWGLISAASILSLIPITIVFLLFQRQFVAASLAGALKE